VKNNVLTCGNLPYIGEKNESLCGLFAYLVIEKNIQSVDLNTANEKEGDVKILEFGKMRIGIKDEPFVKCEVLEEEPIIKLGRQNNEDEFGVIIDPNHTFDSIDKAMGYVKDLKDKLRRRASMEEFPVTTAFPEERKKFLEYGISLMTKKNLPFTDTAKIIRAKSVLSLLVRGNTHTSIAWWLRKHATCNATVEDVKKVEKEGLDMVRDCIEKVRNTNTPIIGG